MYLCIIENLLSWALNDGNKNGKKIRVAKTKCSEKKRGEEVVYFGKTKSFFQTYYNPFCAFLQLHSFLQKSSYYNLQAKKKLKLQTEYHTKDC